MGFIDFYSMSFNPSFTGIALVAQDNPKPMYGAGMFQSFFYWNCLGGMGSIRGRINNQLVSILLLLELPWWLKILIVRLESIKSFNPSFTGIALVAHQ